MTNLTELLKSADGAHITISVGLPDLRQLLKEVVESNQKHLEQVKEALSEEELYTPAEAQKKLGVKARSTFFRWEKAGYLFPVRIGGQVRYKKSDIERLLNSKRGGQK